MPLGYEIDRDDESLALRQAPDAGNSHIFGESIPVFPLFCRHGRVSKKRISFVLSNQEDKQGITNRNEVWALAIFGVTKMEILRDDELI